MDGACSNSFDLHSNGDSLMEGFKKWWNGQGWAFIDDNELREHGRACATLAWNVQDERIKDLEAKLALAEAEVIKRGDHCNVVMEKLAEAEKYKFLYRNSLVSLVNKDLEMDKLNEKIKVAVEFIERLSVVQSKNEDLDMWVDEAQDALATIKQDNKETGGEE
jgi:hypothetical protein